MSNEERVRLRALQDRWLALPTIKRCIEQNGIEAKITAPNIPGPTFNQVGQILYPAWEWYFANAVENAQ